MKKITLCILLALSILRVNAQFTDGSFTEEVDFRLQNVSKTPITSNILIDRVVPVAGIQVFNQDSRIDTSSYAHFKQAWSELYRASYIKNFVTLEQLKTTIENKNYQENVVPIGIINTEFHMGNYGTTAQNANVDFNPSTGLFTNKSGKNPFIKKQTTIIASLISKVTGHTIQFKTDNLFKLYKFGKQIKTLQLITNNSNFTLISNYNLSTNIFNTTYTSSGVKKLQFTITYNDNTTKTTYAKVYVTVPINYDDYHAKNNTSDLEEIVADSDLYFQGYDENQAYQGKNEYRIYYNADNILNKPIIITDGFDPEDKRKIDIIDYEVYDPDEDKSILELMSYDHDNNESTPKKDLVSELNDLGYDVIIINHPIYNSGGKKIDGGSDYIERNAFTFISLLRYINATKQGKEQNVVIGPSMGGLISRYALAYMEKKLAETGDHAKWNHNTRLWVSFDSPHQGANIPIGVQKGIQYFAEEQGVESAKEFIDKQLDKPAPKQMLVNHYTNDTNLPVGAPNFRNRFQNELDVLGMPQNLRKVALVNGSITGVLKGVSKGKYLNIDDDLTHISPLFLANPVAGGIHTLVTNVFFDKLVANFYHSNNSKNGNGEHFTFDAGIKGKFLWWDWYTTRTSFKSIANSRGSYDVAPGGYFNAQGLLAAESDEPDDAFEVIPFTIILHNLNTNVLDETHSFIPTKSALAYTGRKVLDEVIGNQDRVCTGETPFDSYFAPKDNEEHITLTAKNVDWLKVELAHSSPTTDCSYMCVGSNGIVGSDYLCGTETYSISSSTAPNYNWSIVGSNYLVTLKQNGNQVTLTKNGSNASGSITLQCEFGDGNTICGEKTLTKTIFVGAAPIDFVSFRNDIGGSGYFCSSHNNNDFELFPKLSSGETYQYRLRKYPNLNTVYNSSVSRGNFGTVNYTLRPGYFLFEVRRTNSCGTSNWVGFEVEYRDCSLSDRGGDEGEEFSVYPNPTSNNVTIEINEDNGHQDESFEHFKSSKPKKTYVLSKKSNATNLLKYELFDFNGGLIEQGIVKRKKEIDLSNKAKGNYVLKINYKGINRIKKIIVK